MAAQVIQVEQRLNESTALQLAADLNLVDLRGDVDLDFSATAHFEPFGMLLASSAVNRLKRRAEAAGFRVSVSPTGVDADGIAAHMGFWRSMGLDIGRDVGASASKSTYVPMTRIGVDELFRESGGSDPLASGVVEKRARQLAEVLAKQQAPAVLEALTYALRELIRNVMEHAMTPALWIAGMSWPKRDYVQIAVLDEGRGIRASLATNERYRFADDLSAIRGALQPGVSRNAGREITPEKLDRWHDQRHALPAAMFANSGFGLYMISTLCREAGQFMLASGSVALAYVGSAELVTATGHAGTALRIVLHPGDVPDAWDRLFSGETLRGSNAPQPMISASKMKRLGLDKLR